MVTREDMWPTGDTPSACVLCCVHVSVFSRVASELGALKREGIPYQMVPGISSALYAPLEAGMCVGVHIPWLPYCKLGFSQQVLLTADTRDVVVPVPSYTCHWVLYKQLHNFDCTVRCDIAGFPLTDVKLGNSFTVLTGHDLSIHNWQVLAGLPTLVILMGAAKLPDVVQQLLSNGKPADVPVSGGWSSTIYAD